MDIFGLKARKQNAYLAECLIKDKEALVGYYSFSDTKLGKNNEETRGKFPINLEGFPYF